MNTEAEVTAESPHAGVRVEWQDETEPWDHHWADWPDHVRVPCVGEFIDVTGENDLRRVMEVFWVLDGCCTVRLEAHPR